MYLRYPHLSSNLVTIVIFEGFSAWKDWLVQITQGICALKARFLRLKPLRQKISIYMFTFRSSICLWVATYEETFNDSFFTWVGNISVFDNWSGIDTLASGRTGVQSWRSEWKRSFEYKIWGFQFTC